MFTLKYIIIIIRLFTIGASFNLNNKYIIEAYKTRYSPTVIAQNDHVNLKSTSENFNMTSTGIDDIILL